MCRRCGAPVLWAVTAKNGKLMPLDAEPAEHGNVAIRHGRALVLGKDDQRALFELLYTAHFATCPEWQGGSR